MQTIEHWIEWKDKCALGLCREETRGVLQEFARTRFRRFAEVCGNTTNARDSHSLALGPSEAWHLFETYFCLKNSREGKSYKQWLFVRPRVDRDADIDSVQGGATLLMRDVVREWLRREYSPRRFSSLDASEATSAEGPALGLAELLPGTAGGVAEVENRELASMAESEAEGAMTSIDRRERIALLANAMGLSLAHPVVIRLADCSKSALNNAFHSALQGLHVHVRRRHPRESPEVLATLTCLTFEEVKRRILAWGKLEKDCAQLSILEESQTS